MLTHQNLASNITAVAKVLPLGDTDTLLSFLPLCHSFERMAGYYTVLACGSTVAYAESTETVSDNLLEVQPSVVTTVPRLFERIYSRMMKANWCSAFALIMGLPSRSPFLDRSTLFEKYPAALPALCIDIQRDSPWSYQAMKHPLDFSYSGSE
jgi:acyl-CoA synthetase (AMP-forming)/AMP-acid ligase II